MKITEIKQGVKNPNRVNIFVDGKYEFSLDISQMVDFKLKIGLEITSEQLSEYKSASEFGKLYQRTLEWVLVRPRSVRETRDYLARKFNQKKTISSFEGVRLGLATRSAPEKESNSFSSKERPEKDRSKFSDTIVERLVSKGYLDDQKFAEYYVENRFVKKGISRKRLRMELIKKGITNDIIEQVLDKRSDEEEIKKIIAKKRAKYDDDKLISYLVRQGFSYQLAQSLVREMD